MNDLYDIKAFLLQTASSEVLDHEVSSKQPVQVDLIMTPTPENKIWVNFNTLANPKERKTQTAFGMSLLVRQKYKLKAEIYDFRSPKFSLSSTLPLLGNLKCFVKFSPRNDEQDNIYTLIGFSRQTENLKLTSGFMIQNGYNLLSKVSFTPFKGFFIKAFGNYNILNNRVVDYAGIFSYKYNKWEVSLQQTSQDKLHNLSHEARGITLDVCYQHNQNLSFVTRLGSTENKDTTVKREKVVLGAKYGFTRDNYIKFKIADNLLYSVLFRYKLSNNFKFALRIIDNAQSHELMASRIGINLTYEVA